VGLRPDGFFRAFAKRRLYGLWPPTAFFFRKEIGTEQLVFVCSNQLDGPVEVGRIGWVAALIRRIDSRERALGCFVCYSHRFVSLKGGQVFDGSCKILISPVRTRGKQHSAWR